MAGDGSPDCPPLDPGLYLVATPIGNLQDITLRALSVLRAADRIACEDTRLTQKLLNHFGISATTISCHEHNEHTRIEELLKLLLEEGRVAFVSDAGMPGISDPGMHLTRAAIDAGVRVVPIPGANAALTALVASGLPTGRFFYAGFLPSRAGERKNLLIKLARQYSAPGEEEAATLVFYEAPHRILHTLADVEAVWGASARVVLARELTKLHEEFLRGTVAEVHASLAVRERIRGEIVLLIEALPAKPEAVSGSLAQQVAQRAQTEGIGEREALKRVARECGVSKSALYRELQRERAGRQGARD